jgi:hypothetical protein
MRIVSYVKHGWVINLYKTFLARMFILLNYPLHDSLKQIPMSINIWKKCKAVNLWRSGLITTKMGHFIITMKNTEKFHCL